MLGPRCQSPTALGLPVFLPGAGGSTLLGSVSEAPMVPTEARGWAWGGGTGAGVGAVLTVGVPGATRSCSEEISWRSSLISDRSCATSELVGEGDGGAVGMAGEVMDVTVGWATSIILSAMSARESRETWSSPEASIIRTWLGSLWKKSSLRSELSWLGPAESPMSCCILPRSWVGLEAGAPVSLFRA